MELVSDLLRRIFCVCRFHALTGSADAKSRKHLQPPTPPLGILMTTTFGRSFIFALSDCQDIFQVLQHFFLFSVAVKLRKNKFLTFLRSEKFLSGKGIGTCMTIDVEHFGETVLHNVRLAMFACVRR